MSDALRAPQVRILTSQCAVTCGSCDLHSIPRGTFLQIHFDGGFRDARTAAIACCVTVTRPTGSNGHGLSRQLVYAKDQFITSSISPAKAEAVALLMAMRVVSEACCNQRSCIKRVSNPSGGGEVHKRVRFADACF